MNASSSVFCRAMSFKIFTFYIFSLLCWRLSVILVCHICECGNGKIVVRRYTTYLVYALNIRLNISSFCALRYHPDPIIATYATLYLLPNLYVTITTKYQTLQHWKEIALITFFLYSCIWYDKSRHWNKHFSKFACTLLLLLCKFSPIAEVCMALRRKKPFRV